jgi:hypothetical protein
MRIAQSAREEFLCVRQEYGADCTRESETTEICGKTAVFPAFDCSELTGSAGLSESHPGLMPINGYEVRPGGTSVVPPSDWFAKGHQQHRSAKINKAAH